jgi:hypothetical protein
MRKFLILSVISFSAASAQTISLGVLGSVPFTDAVKSNIGTSSNFQVGSSLRVNLPLSLRFELDAFYRPISFNLINTNADFQPLIGNYSASQWQFPFLLQYRFLDTPVVKPFIEAGVSYDRLLSISTPPGSFGIQLNIHPNGASLVVGGGVDVKIPYVRLSGELRYIREGTAEFPNISNLNQAEVIVGVHF